MKPPKTIIVALFAVGLTLASLGCDGDGPGYEEQASSEEASSAPEVSR